MTEKQKREDPDHESIDEKIQRVQDLWDEIARSPEDVKLTKEQIAEAERRLAEYEQNPNKVYPTFTALFHTHRNPRSWSDRVREAALTVETYA